MGFNVDLWKGEFHEERFYSIYLRLLKLHRYNPTVEFGQLIPARQNISSDLRAQQLGQHLLSIPPGRYTVDYYPPITEHVLFPELSTFGLAALPILTRKDDAIFIPEHRRGNCFYYIKPSTTDLKRQEIAEIIKAVDNKGDVQIILMPECSVDEETVEWLRTYFWELPDHTDPDLPGVQLVIIGYLSEVSGEPINTSIVFTREGTEAWVQRKCEGYTIPKDVAETHGITELTEFDPDCKKWDELVGPAGPRSVAVCDAEIGRLAIAICQDLGNSEVLGICESARVSHLFVPLLDTPLQNWRWVQRSSAHYRNPPLSAVIIAATSLLLAARRPKKYTRPWKVLMVGEGPVIGRGPRGQAKVYGAFYECSKEGFWARADIQKKT